MIESFGPSFDVVICGTTGGIGSALLSTLATANNIGTLHAVNRMQKEYTSSKIKSYAVDFLNEEQLKGLVAEIKENSKVRLVIIATGFLHDDVMMPEKSIRDLNVAQLHKSFEVNTIIPTLIGKYFIDLLPRDGKSCFAALSAKVGSISDNHLGGWYSYRAAKAALNMIIKNFAIEIGRKNQSAIIVGLHPGTVDTELSKPFQGAVAQGKLFAPDQAANYLIEVLEKLKHSDTGKVFGWDGTQLPA
jgi:NAD(P)-dependent dehydrogenase (short-subunit alcohol dehydrogenase family)